MKKLLALLLSLCMLLGCCAALAEEAAGPALEKNLVILYTSDVHCGVDTGWGYAGLYAIKENLSADNYVLASGNLFGKGLEASPHEVYEPVFGLDTVFPSDRSQWCAQDFFSRQEYAGFGVLSDSSFKPFRHGESVSNLYVAGAEVGGCNSLYEGSGAGVAIMTAMSVADSILTGE